MEKSFSKKIIAILSVLILIFAFTACNKKEENVVIPSGDNYAVEEKTPLTASVYKKYKDVFNTEEAFNKVESQTNLSKDNLLKDGEAKYLYELRSIDGVKIEVRSNISDNNLSEDGAEVAFIKIPSTDEALDVLAAISSRIQKIQNLQDFEKEPYVTEQYDGVFVVVINKDARDIANTIEQLF